MTRIVAISDTHGKHNHFRIPNGDVLIHAGDIMSFGRDSYEVRDFNGWLGDLPHKHKIVIAGNHDWLFETHRKTRDLLTNATYLDDSGIEILGLKLWGSPVQPEFMNWAFNRKRGDDIQKHWDLIPLNIDVLITHGPPAGFRDWTKLGNESLGCRNLRDTVAKIKPRLHIFGHIHGGYGEDNNGVTHFVNASLLNEAYQPTNAPIVIDL